MEGKRYNIKLKKCPDCGLVYPEGKTHACNIIQLHGYQEGRKDREYEIRASLSTHEAAAEILKATDRAGIMEVINRLIKESNPGEKG